MKLNHLFLLFIPFLFSCVEEKVGPDKSFIKIYGKDADSQAFSIYELSDGRIAMLGQTGSGTFSPQLISGGAQFTDPLVNRAPSITFADQSGNLLERKLYPISGTNVANNPFLESEPDPSRAVFKSIIELANGKFLVSGEWIGVKLVSGFAQPAINLPFLITLDQNLEFESLQDFSENVINDGILRTGIKIKQAADESNYVFFEQVIEVDSISGQPDYANSLPNGFSIVKLDSDGLPTWENDYRYPNSDINTGWDFTFSSSGEVIVIGQDGLGDVSGNTYMSRLDNQSGTQLDSLLFIDNIYQDGLSSTGTILAREGGYAMFSDVYPNVQVVLYSETFGRRGGGTFTDSGLGENGQGQFIRSASSTAAGGYIVTTEIIVEGDDVGTGEVYKLDSEGNPIWSYAFVGHPQAAIELQDGSIVILTNPRFNELTPKTTIIKLNPDGTL